MKNEKQKNYDGNGNNRTVAYLDGSKSFFENLANHSDFLLTTKETAEYLRSTPKQIRKWVYQGKIRSFKLCGKSLRFKKSDLDLLIEGGRKWAL